MSLQYEPASEPLHISKPQTPDQDATTAAFKNAPKLLAIADRIANIPAVVAYLAARKITPI